MLELIPFQAYRVKILYPDTWHIFINPSKSFDYYDGFVKIDRSSERNSPNQASLSVRWAKMQKEITIDEYMEELKMQYAKKQKKNKKDHFEILSMEPVKGLSHKAYLMHTSIKANHSIYRAFGKEETVCSMQLTTYCEITKRILIASIASVPEDIKAQREHYQQMLFSLTCH